MAPSAGSPLLSYPQEPEIGAESGKRTVRSIWTAGGSTPKGAQTRNGCQCSQRRSRCLRGIQWGVPFPFSIIIMSSSDCWVPEHQLLPPKCPIRQVLPELSSANEEPRPVLRWLAPVWCPEHRPEPRWLTPNRILIRCVLVCLQVTILSSPVAGMSVLQNGDPRSHHTMSVQFP